MSTLYTPPDQNFTCQNTGECCGLWEIPVKPEEAHAIMGAEWGSDLPASLGRSKQPGFVPSQQNPGLLVPNLALAHGRCPFHDPHKHHCSIHAKLGESAKPLTCQQFPYRFTVTPAGTFVGLSFSCPTVRRNVGTPLTAQLDPLREFVKRTRLNLNVPSSLERVTLLPGREVDWTRVLRVEKLLDDVLKDTSLPLWRGLVVGERLTLQLQAVAEKSAPEGKTMVPPERLIEHVRREAFVPPRLALGDRLMWYRLATMLKPRREFYTAWQSRFARWKHWGRDVSRWAGLAWGGRFSLPWKLGGPDGAEGEATTVSVAAARAVSPQMPAEADDLVRRFVRVKIHGNDFFGPGYNQLSFIGGFRFLMVAVAAALFAARCRAAARGRHELDFSDVDFGVEKISDCYFSTNVLARTFGLTVEAMMIRRPLAARSILLAWALPSPAAPSPATPSPAPASTPR